MTSINVLPSRPGLVTYDPDFLPRAEADALLAELLAATPWQAETTRMYGRELPVPRLTSWHGEADYTYGNRRHVAAPWTSSLLKLKEQAEALAQARFNSVLLNLYRGGQDSVAWHADDETDLGPAPIVASISLGAMRDFRLKPKPDRPPHPPVTLKLEHGSLLLMGAGLQAGWLHAVPKTARPVGPRINLTYRYIH